MPSVPPKIYFFFDDVTMTLKDRTDLKSFIEGIFKKEKKKLASLNYIFCSDKRLLEINKAYLGHDYYTDIITFDLSKTKATEGEIYISVDRVKENAKLMGTTQKDEFLRVIIHGALHLCGFKDLTTSQKRKMRSLENHYLSLI